MKLSSTRSEIMSISISSAVVPLANFWTRTVYVGGSLAELSCLLFFRLSTGVTYPAALDGIRVTLKTIPSPSGSSCASSSSPWEPVFNFQSSTSRSHDSSVRVVYRSIDLQHFETVVIYTCIFLASHPAPCFSRWFCLLLSLPLVALPFLEQRSCSSRTRLLPSS